MSRMFSIIKYNSLSTFGFYSTETFDYLKICAFSSLRTLEHSRINYDGKFECETRSSRWHSSQSATALDTTNSTRQSLRQKKTWAYVFSLCFYSIRFWSSSGLSVIESYDSKPKPAEPLSVFCPLRIPLFSILDWQLITDLRSGSDGDFDAFLCYSSMRPELLLGGRLASLYWLSKNYVRGFVINSRYENRVSSPIKNFSLKESDATRSPIMVRPSIENYSSRHKSI